MILCTGIRCVNRTPLTVFRTLESATNAGLNEDLRLFLDGEFPQARELEKWGTVVHRTKRSGAWPNFYLSMSEMFYRNPSADLYILMEDDVVFCRDIRSYLSGCYQQLEVASLFTSGNVEGAIAQRGFGFHRLNPGWRISSGGQAWVFSNRRLREFLHSEFVLEYRRTPPQNLNRKDYRLDGLHHTDSVVGKFSSDVGCGIQYHFPSLVQHVGEESFMYPGFRGKRSARYSDHFPGEDVQATEIARA